MDDPKILARLQPDEYYRKWMEQHYPTRPDGRPVDAFRPLTVQTGTIGTADGSATVRLGETTVVAGVKLEVAEAEAAAGRDGGFLVVNVTLCAGCSPAVRAGPPSDRAQSLTGTVSTLLRELAVVAEDSLIIGDGKLVWVVHVDALLVNDAGNVFDAVWLAILAALQKVSLPPVRIDEENGMIYGDFGGNSSSNNCSNSNDSNCLRLSRLPLPLSFVHLPERATLIADPTNKEEAILTANARVLIDASTGLVLHCESNCVPADVLGPALHQPGVKTYIEETRSLLLSL